MFKVLYVFFVFTLSSVCFGRTVENAKLKTSRGAEVNVAVNVPDTFTGKTAAVVIAPGQGYHMDLPIVKQLAETLASNGIIAYRFNWNYYSNDPQNGQPSDDLSKEVEDMQAVVAYAKSDSRVDATQLIISGKSLGSMVSYLVFTKDPSAKALVLMTPVCTSRYDEHDQPLPAPVPAGAQNYPGLNDSQRPIVMVLGNADPLCSLPMFYDFVKGSKGNVSTVVVGGNHSWNVATGNDPLSAQRNVANIAAGVQIVSHWINLILNR